MRAFLWFMMALHIVGMVARTCKLANGGYPDSETPRECGLSLIASAAIAFWAFYLLFS